MVRLFRQFSAIYLLAAGFYTCLIVLHARPELVTELHAAGTAALKQGTEIADNAASWTSGASHALATRVTIWLEHKNAKPAPPTAAVSSKLAGAPVETAKQIPTNANQQIAVLPVHPKAAMPRAIRNLPPKIAEPRSVIAKAPPRVESSQQKSVLAQPVRPESAPPEESLPGAGEIARVGRRLRADLTSELYAGFDLFLYVSAAERGPWAQRMYVFDKQSDGDLALMHAWPVSTGRDARVPTKNGIRLALDTPAGYYQLDPGRFYAHYTSMEWGMPMPYAMFFNWVHDGDQTGLAIHGASGEDLALLGTRASAGCIRLAPENAKELFNLVRTKYKGEVPRFAYDTKTSTMSNDGILWHDRNGNLRLTNGYRVLVIVENFGGEPVVAMLY
jgi:lipoprotein-anchoring transpeptidase ErfK/SrfK